MKKDDKDGRASLLMLSKKKFAFTANILIVSLILHNVIYAYSGEEKLFFTLFVATLVYFIAMSIYSLYIDVIRG